MYSYVFKIGVNKMELIESFIPVLFVAVPVNNVKGRLVLPIKREQNKNRIKECVKCHYLSFTT